MTMFNQRGITFFSHPSDDKNRLFLAGIVIFSSDYIPVFLGLVIDCSYL